MRDSFVFYRSFYEALKGMDKNVQADCLMALAQYALDGDMPALTPEVRMFMTLAKPQIDANNQKFVNGSKGGRPKRINNQTETKTEPNPNLMRNVNEKCKYEKEKQTKRKISFSDVLDWESLFDYWESWKKGGRYKNAESRSRMLAKLKELTRNDFDLAKRAICHCVDSGYQGFANGAELFYKPSKDPPGREQARQAALAKEREFLSQFDPNEEF